MPLDVSHMTYCLQVLMWPEFLETQICEYRQQSNQVAELRVRQAEGWVGINLGLLAKYGVVKDSVCSPAFWFCGTESFFILPPVQLMLKSGSSVSDSLLNKFKWSVAAIPL